MKIQVARLSEKLRQPDALVRDLHNLLDFYADRTHRPGQFGEPPPLLATYKIPTPVLRQIERELSPLAGDPPAALALVDSLWAEPVIEFRRLAIMLLGRIPPNPPQPVLDRIQAWIAAQPESRILDGILEHGLARIRQETPDVYYPMLEAWLKADELYPRQAGLRALRHLLADPGFENLPAVSRLILPFIRLTPKDLRIDLVAVLRGLAGRFPQEASYLLKQNLAPDRPDAIWLARQVVGDFPAEFQGGLREVLREYPR